MKSVYTTLGKNLKYKNGLVYQTVNQFLFIQKLILSLRKFNCKKIKKNKKFNKQFFSSASNNLSIWSLDGQCIDTIKCHEGFMGPRMNRPTCVDFHSFKVSLAVGFSDNTVSVFTINKTNGY